jgi:carbonic anhydrase
MDKAISRRHSRRGALRLLGLGAGAAVCPFCLSSLAQAADSHAPHWSYEGEGGPAQWGKLSPDFKTCELGIQQTPIDLKDGIRAEIGGVELAYPAMPLRVLNNGHTIQVNCAPGGRARINDAAYDLLQFHFHHPSEHLLSGKPFDLECHFVHKSAAGNLAVVGVFLKPGAENPGLQPIWQAMPAQEGPEHLIETAIDLTALLPRSRDYFRYIGSLTTPPCSEGVLWTVFRSPIEASPEQIRRFAQLFPLNARPVMPLNRRFLLETGRP